MLLDACITQEVALFWLLEAGKDEDARTIERRELSEDDVALKQLDKAKRRADLISWHYRS